MPRQSSVPPTLVGSLSFICNVLFVWPLFYVTMKKYKISVRAKLPDHKYHKFRACTGNAVQQIVEDIAQCWLTKETATHKSIYVHLSFVMRNGNTYFSNILLSFFIFSQTFCSIVFVPIMSTRSYSLMYFKIALK